MSTDAATPDPNAIVSHEQDGRILSGVGVSEEQLAATMDRHAPQEPDEASASAPAAAPAADKPTRGQARFSELTKRAKESEAKYAALEQQFNEFKAQHAAQAAPAPVAERPPSAPQPPSPSVPNGGESGHSTRAQPSEDDIGTKYKNYGEFVVDSARWVAEQQQSLIDARVQKSIEADRASREFLGVAERTWAEGRKLYADFDAMRSTGPGSMVPLAPEKIEAILRHPASPHLQYAIVKDGALAKRLAEAEPITFGLLLASIDPTPAAASLASTAGSVVSTPPPPVQPVGAGSSTSTPSLNDLAKGGDYAAYKAARDAQRRQTRR